MFVCMGACVGVFVCMYALRIVSMDKILCFINTLIINYYSVSILRIWESHRD